MEGEERGKREGMREEERGKEKCYFGQARSIRKGI